MKNLPVNLIEKMNGFLTKCGFVATEDYLNELVDGTYLKKSILEIKGFDTAEREMFFELLAQKLTGMSWPCNGDSKSYADEFLKKLVEAVKNEKRLTEI